MTEVEDITIVDPKKTRLVHDATSGYAASKLHIEGLLRTTPPSGPELTLGHQGAMNEVAYQHVPACQALKQGRPRILIADGTGLGKTLEAGILVAELMRRSRGRRILVVTLKSMLTQFQKEMWSRFAIPLVRLDSAGIQRVRDRIPVGHNPFAFFEKTIISIDTLKAAKLYRSFIEKSYWDIIVVDEAQNVARRGNGLSLRHELAQLLASRSDTLIMLSATPHDGNARSFASLVAMLDPTAIANHDKYGKEELEGKNLLVRRFKKDIRHEVTSAFQKRETILNPTKATPEEEDIFDYIGNSTDEQLSVRVEGG